ncbi:uncharacterized protein EDB93DRAFT_1254650 [Suillus bovinus]|uniref:uncharacterized protein n=1 Tax=Suillus bovinus TaxID=48563 RepID=UPI001B85BCB3|nr:uncharacterized protein EDB93DRAFT_1254650 [Suillus bovinus]KAG2134041.1 hypothetical protein EDB93DRAFT_1254650 [Suillus bovinus]
MSSFVPFFHLKQRSYKLVQLRGIIAKTDNDKYQNQVVAQVCKLKADLQPKDQIKDSEEAYKGYFEMPASDVKDITRRIIQELGRDEEILKIFCVKGFLDQNNHWTSAIACPDLTQTHHATRSNRPSTEDLMAIFLNHLVEEVLALLGPSHIHRKWSAEFCQRVLPGLAEDHKPDIILVDSDLPEDWRNLTTVGKMKKSSIDIKNPLWFDEVAKWANTMYASQDSRTFALVLQFLGAQFTFVFFDRGGSVCLDVLGIHEDSEEYFRLVLYLSLAHPSVYMHKSMCFPNMTIVGTGLLGFNPTIVHDPKSDSHFIQTKHLGKVPINMVLFISNNLNGHGTIVRQVTLPKDQINQALKNGLNCEALQKWLKGMVDMESIVVKDTWLDLTMPHTEGMALNYLQLKGVQDVTRSLFEGLMLFPPAFVLPALALKYKEAQALPWQSTVHNRLS